MAFKNHTPAPFLPTRALVVQNLLPIPSIHPSHLPRWVAALLEICQNVADVSLSLLLCFAFVAAALSSFYRHG
jgi:hypothetical protein